MPNVSNKLNERADLIFIGRELLRNPYREGQVALYLVVLPLICGLREATPHKQIFKIIPYLQKNP